MKVTFILKNLSEYFYSELDKSSDKFKYLNSIKDLSVTRKIGTGTFSEGVDFSLKYRQCKEYKSYKLENRKGYKLATFIF